MNLRETAKKRMAEKAIKSKSFINDDDFVDIVFSVVFVFAEKKEKEAQDYWNKKGLPKIDYVLAQREIRDWQTLKGELK
jgi:hypothetical protein